MKREIIDTLRNVFKFSFVKYKNLNVRDRNVPNRAKPQNFRPKKTLQVSFDAWADTGGRVHDMHKIEPLHCAKGVNHTEDAKVIT